MRTRWTGGRRTAVPDMSTQKQIQKTKPRPAPKPEPDPPPVHIDIIKKWFTP